MRVVVAALFSLSLVALSACGTSSSKPTTTPTPGAGKGACAYLAGSCTVACKDLATETDCKANAECTWSTTGTPSCVYNCAALTEAAKCTKDATKSCCEWFGNP